MARSIGMTAGDAVFRAVLVLKYPGSEPFTKYEGPYGEKAQAKGRVTFWKNYLGRYAPGTEQDSYADGHVEQGSVTWTQV